MYVSERIHLILLLGDMTGLCLKEKTEERFSHDDGRYSLV